VFLSNITYYVLQIIWTCSFNKEDFLNLSQSETSIAHGKNVFSVYKNITLSSESNTQKNMASIGKPCFWLADWNLTNIHLWKCISKWFVSW
jgi:hypothetical protein